MERRCLVEMCYCVGQWTGVMPFASHSLLYMAISSISRICTNKSKMWLVIIRESSLRHRRYPYSNEVIQCCTMGILLIKSDTIGNLLLNRHDSDYRYSVKWCQWITKVSIDQNQGTIWSTLRARTFFTKTKVWWLVIPVQYQPITTVLGKLVPWSP